MLLTKQKIRLLDIFFITPFLLYVAFRYDIGQLSKALLILIAVSTFLYNTNNYIKELGSNE